VTVDTRKLSAAGADAAARTATTIITDSFNRIATATDMAWQPIPVGHIAGPVTLLPERVTAVYRGVTIDDHMSWTVNVHVSGRTQGKSGRPVEPWRSAWFVAQTGDGGDRQDWPADVLVWVERYHPDRGHPDNDPTGSYL
jgi:hypothetical protein